MRMPKLSPDPLALVSGLLAILVGGVGLAGALDGRSLGGGWLVPGLLAALAVAILAGIQRPSR